MEIKEKLGESLNNISEFAEDSGLTDWHTVFKKALSKLTSNEPGQDYYNPKIHPDNYPLFSRQLLFAACCAWVFDGMGSWNDTLNSTEQYDRVSEDLYDSIIQAIIAVVNSY